MSPTRLQSIKESILAKAGSGKAGLIRLQVSDKNGKITHVWKSPAEIKAQHKDKWIGSVSGFHVAHSSPGWLTVTHDKLDHDKHKDLMSAIKRVAGNRGGISSDGHGYTFPSEHKDKIMRHLDEKHQGTIGKIPEKDASGAAKQKKKPKEETKPESDTMTQNLFNSLARLRDKKNDLIKAGGGTLGLIPVMVNVAATSHAKAHTKRVWKTLTELKEMGLHLATTRGMHFVQYSDKAFLITGETKLHLAALQDIKKQIGTGSYNGTLKGWVFPNKHKETVLGYVKSDIEAELFEAEDNADDQKKIDDLKTKLKLKKQ